MKTDIFDCKHYTPPFSLGALASQFQPAPQTKRSFHELCLALRLLAKLALKQSIQLHANTWKGFRRRRQTSADRDLKIYYYGHDQWWLSIKIQSQGCWYERSNFSWKWWIIQLVDGTVAKNTRICEPPAYGSDEDQFSLSTSFVFLIPMVVHFEMECTTLETQ